MAFDFPNTPAEDQEYTPAGGPTYVFKTPRWLVKGTSGTADWNTMVNKPATFPPTVPIAQSDVTNLTTDLSGRVLKAGDTMTGSLAIMPAAGGAGLTMAGAGAGGDTLTWFSKSASGQGNYLDGLTAWSKRWRLTLGDVVAESGSNAGSNLTVGRYTDAGALIDTPLAINRSDGIVQMPAGSTTLTQATADNSTKVATTAFVKANLATVAGGATISDTAPAASQGALWWNSANGNLYISYNDGSSTQWVQINTVGA